MSRKIFLLSIIIFTIASGISQVPVAVGEWRTHFNYTDGKQIAVLQNKYFLATSNVLFYMDLSDKSLHRLGLIEGLSDIGIQTIEADESTNTLLIAYTNSNIDLYTNDMIFNVPDIAQKQISGDKTIYNVHCYDDNAYLACGFGIVILDLKKGIIKDTWFFQKEGKTQKVFDLTINNDTVYAATSDGLFSNYLNSTSIAHFASWHEAEDSVFKNKKVSFIEAFNDKIHAVVVSSLIRMDTLYDEDSLILSIDTVVLQSVGLVYTFDNTSWKLDSVFGFESINNLRSMNDRLVVVRGWGAHAYAYHNGILQYNNSYGSELASDALVDEWGLIWLADQRKGIVRQVSGGSEIYSLSGPAGDDVWALDIAQSKLSFVPGAVAVWYPLWKPVSVSIFQNEEWNNLMYYDDAFSQNITYGALDVLINPTNTNELFVASYISGLLHIQDGKVLQIYDATNSSLEMYGGRIQVNALAFDENYNLWMLNSQATKPLSVRTKDGNWLSFNIWYSPGEIVGKMLIDSRGWIWMTGNRETSLMIFNPAGTPLNTADDQLVKLNTSLSEEEGAFEYIYSLAEDKDGYIWLGTNKGIKIYYSPSQLIENPSTLPYAPRVEMDSLTELLLNYEIIKCIKVDQGNRKWVGTDNAGVFLLSEDGKEELLHFTTENSPLLSNCINDIEIEGHTGEVFIATDKGLVSFRYTATDGKEDYEEIKIFPNPVREGFAGYISITGLKENSELKITDAFGGLVYRTKSNGGTAVWDGFRFDGAKASTGVYFVFVSDITGKEKKAGKILFIR